MPTRTWLITGFGRGMTEQLFDQRDRVVGSIRTAGDISTVAALLDRYLAIL